MTKLVILEPLGISKEKLLSLAESAVQNRMEITAYDDRKEDLQTLIERSKMQMLLFSQIFLTEKRS